MPGVGRCRRSEVAETARSAADAAHQRRQRLLNEQSAACSLHDSLSELLGDPLKAGKGA